MELTQDFDAILINWSILESMRITGTCFADKRPATMHSGFVNGEPINTSPVQWVERTKDGPVAVTRSGTRYLLA